jgi:hypothetical protein
MTADEAKQAVEKARIIKTTKNKSNTHNYAALAYPN